MNVIMSAVTEIPMTHIVAVLLTSTVILIFGKLKLALLVNYFFIFYSGHLWDFAVFGNTGSSDVNTSNFAFAGFLIIIVFLAALSLMLHKE